MKLQNFQRNSFQLSIHRCFALSSLACDAKQGGLTTGWILIIYSRINIRSATGEDNLTPDISQQDKSRERLSLRDQKWDQRLNYKWDVQYLRTNKSRAPRKWRRLEDRLTDRVDEQLGRVALVETAVRSDVSVGNVM